MRSMFRLYGNTSRSNDTYLHKELLAMNLSPKYDEHLHSFYFNANFRNLFELSFQSRVLENLYIQIGQKFPITTEREVADSLSRLQLRNYLPMKRGLVENIALKILIKESSHILSENVLTFLLQNALQKQIIKKEYYQNILEPTEKPRLRHDHQSFYEIRQIVHRKWIEEDAAAEEQLRLLQSEQKQLTNDGDMHELDTGLAEIQTRSTRSLAAETNRSLLETRQTEVGSLLSPLPYYPMLTLYIRKNKGRILLKVNKKQLYKHGWKKQVGWGPMRQSLAAAMLKKTTLFDDPQENVKLWDPLCGSGTLPLVAASMFYRLPIRNNYLEYFNWHHWPIYKSEYLEEYQQEAKKCEDSKRNQLHIIASDSDFQTVNYALKNLEVLSEQFHLNKLPQSPEKVVLNRKPTDQLFELIPNHLVCICGDFQKVINNITRSKTQQQQPAAKLNIVTNLPYTKARSEQTIPLNQLVSTYKRFNKMIANHKEDIDNVFVVINNEREAIADQFHFLNLSTETWELVGEFDNGGIPVGLYAWALNRVKVKFEDYSINYKELLAQKQELDNLKDTSHAEVTNQLQIYREKVKALESKHYNVPSHLKKTKAGWRRIKERRRIRHLQSAYEVFSKRRDKMIAFKEYERKKLQIRMISRGVAWKRKNLKLVPSEKLLEYEGELKAEFESKIEDAVKRQQDYDTWKKAKADNIEKEKEKKKPITSQMKTARSYKGKTKTQSGQGRKNGGGKRVRIEKKSKTENKPRKVSNQRQQRKSRN